MRSVEFHFRGGCANEKVAEATRIGIVNHMINDDQYRSSILATLRSVGWSGTRKISPRSKIKINGTLRDVGSVVWFGNMHSVHEYIMALEILHTQNVIKSGIIITHTRQEAVRRFNRDKTDKTTSTGNYCEMDTLNNHIETFQDIINIPLTIIGIEVT